MSFIKRWTLNRVDDGVDNSMDFDDLEFDEIAGEVSFNPEILQRFIDRNWHVFETTPSEHLMGRIADWYMDHVGRGGRRNSAMDNLLEKASRHLVN